MIRPPQSSTLFPYTTLSRSRGRPAAGVAVSLARRSGDGWAELATTRSDTNGRVANLLPGDLKSPAGTYRLRFDTGAYFATRPRSEEHTSELQSRLHLVCRLL